MNKIKEIITITIITMMIIITLIIINVIDTHYMREGQIDYLDKCNDIIYVLDNTDNVWSFEGNTECYTIGERVTMRMHTNYTDDKITDDRIEKVFKKN